MTTRRAGWHPRDAAALAALLALYAALHWLWSDPWGVELQPTPDAMEYVGAAESWLENGIPAIALSDGALYPTRYAVGFPAVLAAWMAVFPGGQVAGLALNWLVGFLVVSLTYLVGRHVATRLGAFAASALVALSPRMAEYAEVIMSDPLATLLVLAITGVAIARARRGGALSAILIGTLAGALCTVRLTHVLSLVYILPLALLMRRHVRASDILWGLVGFLPFVVLIAVAQAWLNGSPLRQGYDLWASYATTPGQGWNLRFAFREGKEPWEAGMGTRIHPHLHTYVPMLLGLVPRGYLTLMFYPWPIAVGVVWALFESERHPLRRRWSLILLIALGVQLAVWSLYYYWADRFFMPLMPLAILLGCAGLTPRLREGWSPRNFARGGLLLLALLQQCAATQLYLASTRPWELSERRGFEALAEHIPPDALVIVDSYHILASDVLTTESAPRRVMNFAVHGRDMLLHESRAFEVEPLRAGDGRAAALLGNDDHFDPLALAEIRSAWAEGREVWLVLPDQPLIGPADVARHADGLVRIRNQVDGTLSPVEVEGARAHEVWRWTSQSASSSVR